MVRKREATRDTTPLGRCPGAVEFATADPERAHAFLRATYVDHAMRILGDHDSFHMRHIQQDVGQFSVATLSHTMAVEHRNEPLGFVLVGHVRAGQMEHIGAEGTVRLSPGDLFVFDSSDEPFTVRRGAIELQLIRINHSAFTPNDRAARSPAPRFTGLRPISPRDSRRFTNTLDWVTGELLANSEAVAHPLITGAASRVLADTMLVTFPHSTLAAQSRRDDAHPAVLRRAVEFIEAHADSDISLLDIAMAARVTPRAVQHVFRRHYGTTPSAYLRQVRLEHAHQELQAADPTRGDTVAAIAHRWGFLNLGRFADLYRAAYRHSPRHTLIT
jgi:AraC-like DNA-binding protein